MSASLLIREPLGERRAATPLSIGSADADIVVPGAAGTLRIDHTGGQFWVRPADDSPTRNAAMVINGAMQAGATVLTDGDVLQFADAQIAFSAAAPSLQVLHLAGNATVAPLHEEALPGEAVAAGAAEIRATGTLADTAWQAGRSAAGHRKGRLPLWIAIPAALLALVLVGLFRLVNTPLEVMPENARVEVSGLLSWHSGGRLYLMPGQHRISVSAEGYESRLLELDTRSEQPLPERVDLPLLPGILEVDTQGIEAEVLVDGRPAGKAPGAIEAPAGSREVLVRAPRRVEFTARVEVQGAGKRQPLVASLLPAYGWLVLDTAPGGGRVRIDDADQGSAPLRVELDAGLRKLSISASGRRAWSSQVAIQAGQTLDLGVIDLSAAPPVIAAAVENTSAGSAPAPEAAAAQTAPPAPPPPPSPRLQSPLVGTLILMPVGTFRIGSDRREQGRRSNEVAREVTLSRPYYLAEKEISNAQFRAFKAGHVSGIALEKSLDLDSQAVSNVGWNDAVEFCNWLSLREGLPAAYERRNGRWQLVQPHNHGYRLPSEAEWEYAARFVDGNRWQRYAWGDSLPPPAGAANLGGSESLPPRPGPDVRLASALPDYKDEHAVIAPTGSYARSPAGFHDLGGNVSEWTHDVYTSLPESTPVTDPFGPDTDGAHVVRGPSWRSSAIAGLRLAWRESSALASQTIGFRVARYVEKTP